MIKLPREPDQFKHFAPDPPEIKLEAWKCLLRRNTIRDIAVCIVCTITSIAWILARYLAHG